MEDLQSGSSSVGEGFYRLMSEDDEFEYLYRYGNVQKQLAAQGVAVGGSSSSASVRLSDNVRPEFVMPSRDVLSQ
jgi:hypothetical protein